MRCLSITPERRPDSYADYAKFRPAVLEVSERGLVEQIWHPICMGAPGDGDGRTIKDRNMLDTALLIASALSLALMVAFSELP